MAHSLNADLLTAQTTGYPTGGYAPAIGLVFTSKDGGTTYDYSFNPTLTTNILQHVEQREEKESDSGIILLTNYNKALPTDITGYWVELGWGHNTSSGVRYAGSDNCVAPRLWVMKQTDVSGAPKGSKPQLYTLFELQGMWSAVLNVQPLRLGTRPFYQGEGGLLSGKTIYGCLEYLIETALTNQTGKTFLLEAIGTQDDGIISATIPFTTVTSGSFVVGNTYRILTIGTTDYVTEQGVVSNTIGLSFVAVVVGTGTGTAVYSLLDISASGAGADGLETYGHYISRLLSLTNCVLRPTFGLSFKVIYPQTSDAVDETYYSSNASGHPFYQVEHRRLNMAPNLIEVWGDSDADGLPDVVGYYYDSDHYTSVTAGSFVVSTIYYITAIGSTDFTLIGASANTVGLSFTATGAGAGTGTANAYTGKFMSVSRSYFYPGITTSGGCDTQASVIGRDLKAQLVGNRVIVPMDARVELHDRIAVIDVRGT